MTTQIVSDKSQLLSQHIRNIKDFPKPGIVFRDITPLLLNAKCLTWAVTEMANPYRNKNIDLVVGAESRGFIFGTAVAIELNCGFVPIRKNGKLPAKTFAQKYNLEYGTNLLEIHADAIKPGQRVLIVDDLLATGGTLNACSQLVKKLDGHIEGISLLIELAYLKGRKRLSQYPINTLITYDDE
ncbi:MAG: adenine phosphoribosyltransferase [Planctomycetes bacterium]|nr:adenine phosphoribosyltransferase [Planctomycetota bacterium]